MKLPCRILPLAASSILMVAFLATFAAAQNVTTEISSTPSSLSFAQTFVGKAAGSKVLTINNLTTSGQIIIENISFDCGMGYGISSGLAPFTLGQTQTITHYSVFFQPLAAQSYPCNFVITLNDGSFLAVPLTGTGESGGAVASDSPSSLNFANQALGTTSAAKTVTITNSGTTNLTLNAITTSPSTFTTNNVTLPATIAAGASKQISVFYTPTQAISEIGAIDFTFNEVPDVGSSLSGNGVASKSLAVSTFPTLPQATKSSAYQATLATSGGTGPFTWSVASGSTLPAGLSLSSAGVISGTLASSVAAGTYTFTVQVTDSTSATDNSTLTLTVFASLGDNCNDISFDVPNTSTPIVALNDLGTGTYQGSEGGLYPNGSNVRPSTHDADGVAIADAIQPLDENGNPSSTGKMVLMAIGESTAQNEFNRYLPIANADPAKNPALVIVNGAQGGATPNNFTATNSAYWLTVLNNYLPQNNVTAQQVVAIWMEDTDGIASGTFPTDISALQTQYETMMQTMLTLFPNLKLVYFSSRVYGGYSNGVGAPDNPEPYAYEVGFAVKWAIEDQIDGNANLNYKSGNGAVVAPWMSWGPYYWSNGMLGRSDGTVWDCQDFSADGTHPSSTFGQLKVAAPLLTFLKTDDTTTPWYLAPNRLLTPTAGNSQSGPAGTQLPVALTATATNNGAPVSGVLVTFTDGGLGGTFGNPTVTTGASGTATTTYTLPPTIAQTITVSATNSNYSTASFTESATAPVQILSVNGGNNQTGAGGATLPTALTVLATSSGTPVQGVTVSFSDGGVGGSFGSPTAVTNSSGIATTTYTLPPDAQTVTINATSSGYTGAIFTETSTAAVKTLAVNGGNNQSGGVSTTLPTALSVLATNNGSPASGISVTFSDGGAGGTFGTPTAVTNSSGIASSTYTLPSTAKTVTVSATATGYSTATFTETATTSAQTLAVATGNNQTGNIGATLPAALGVIATKSGKVAAGVAVTFSDGGAGGTFGTPTVTTGANGRATTTYTLPSTAQTVTVTATATGYTSAVFTETATSATVTSIVVSSGSKQTGTVGSTLPNPLVVTAKNSSGKAVAGASITFSDASAGGTFSPNPAITATNGQASTSYTLPTIPKATITVTAADGTVSALLTEKAVVGSPANLTIVSGNSQTGNHGVKLAKNLVMLVSDQFSNPIAGVTVNFTDNGAGGTFSNAAPVTNATGQVSISYTAGLTPGTVTISGSTATLGPVNFTETIH